jgi:hypothetical protein
MPSRAPELNPVENVWQYLRQNWLSNTVFKNYDERQAILQLPSDDPTEPMKAIGGRLALTRAKSGAPEPSLLR